MNLIDQLVDAAYESGYYSGKGEFGQPHHLEVWNRRNVLSRELSEKVQGLIDAAQDVVRGAEREIYIADGCDCGACTRRSTLAKALEAFEKKGEK